jgi:signal transduction histidine kinase/CheY-like chemotaxis protein
MASNNKQQAERKFTKSLSVKLVVQTLFFSLFISLLVSGIQIYTSYTSSIAEAENRYHEIETGYIPSLNAGLWEVNNQRVDALLDSIAQLPNVGRIYLIDEEKKQISKNDASDNVLSRREMTLVYTENGVSFDVGILGVELNNDSILAQLKHQALVTATITSLTLFSSALLILFLFQRQVSRHLQTMASFANAFDVHKLSSPLKLDRKPNAQPDELDIVVGAINDMQNELRHELELRAGVEQELRAHQENLERVVMERTLQLKTTADQLAVAADVAELGVWQWNVMNNSMQWNNQMFSIFSQPSSLADNGLNYHHWYERIHPDDAKETEASLRAEVEGRGKIRSVYRILLPDGQIRYVQAALKIERDEQGRAQSAIGINIDITAQMEIENNLRTAKQQADAANAAKSSFLANMSHEIRTPMNGVLGMLQLLQKTELDARQRDYLHKSQNAAKSLLNLLNDILDLSKAEAGKLLIDNGPFDLESLLQDLAVVLSGGQKEQKVELMFDLDPKLPRMLIGDKFRLQQILINLAGNALKFTMEGQVSVILKQIEHSDKDVRIKFSVIDTGIGISPDHVEHIFDEFVQAEASTTRRFGGTGLGLVICKHLVESMGGELLVHSELGHGSEFFFELTLEQSESEASSCYGSSHSLINTRILVVDDNAVSREILSRTIGQFTKQVDETGSGLDALQMIKQADSDKLAYDIVLMDWRMPNLDGLSAAELIKTDELIKNKPVVILLTAYGREELLATKGSQTTAYNDVLFKPVTPLQLIETLQRALGQGDLKVKPEISGSEKALSGLVLLVVEDNVINRQIAFELLQDNGAEVEMAECGLDGVSSVLEARRVFDAVLMDIQMPDIDGMEATRRIRSDQRFTSLPIIAMTANVSQQDIDMGIAAGMNGHIGKPIDMEQVIQTILSLLNKA